MTTTDTKQIPMVEYLVLDDGDPHLLANRCTSCGARYFDRRNGCGHCGGTEFERAAAATEGIVRSFTIVHRAAPTVPTPFVSVVVDLADGTVSQANLVGVDVDPANVKLGMPVRLTTFVAGTDGEGTEAVAFGYTPKENA